MNFEYINLNPLSMRKIAKIDLSNIDKLFLELYLINDQYLEINPQYLDYLKNLNPNKIILCINLSQEKNQVIAQSIYTTLDRFHDTIKWHTIILNNTYLYKDYNFIFTDNYNALESKLLPEKVNILLSDDFKNQAINDVLRFSSSLLVDLIVESKEVNDKRIIKFCYGIPIVTFSYNQQFSYYIKLIDGKVYLKKMNLNITMHI